jgi:uncharacterized secreted protein with C-terminal beta-propeller domain
MGSEARSGARPAIAAAAAGFVIAGCAVGSTGSAVRTSPSLRLVTYDNCADLLGGLRKATAAHVGPYGLPGDPMMRPLTGGRIPGDATPARPAEAQHSATNVQEPGVDEPDLVKTDGRRIVTVARGRLRVIDAASRKETGTLDLAAGRGWTSGELLLSGDRVVVVMRPPLIYARDDLVARTPAQSGPRLVLVDIKSTPRVVSSIQVDGSYLDARQVGSVARVVVRSAPRVQFPQRRPGPADEATAANRKIVEKAPVDAWLPHYTVTRGGRSQTLKVPCDQVSHPPSYTGTSVLSVFTVDLSADLADATPVSVLAGGQTVYGSGGTLYVTDRPGPDPAGTTPQAGRTPQVPSRTDIYQFDIGGTGRPRFAASGSVPGELLNQYSMSEYGGHLRVATTWGQGVQPPGATPAGTESAVYVLARRGGRLEQVGKVGGLGRGERVYAVRFLGPVGYVVTFRQTDPLYILDLRDPVNPRTTGELKLSGYSAYLHPAGDGRLIGVGQEADAKGRPLGTQVSLFDVRDPAVPRKVGGYRVVSGWSAAEFDPHAFLYWPRTGLTVLPMAGAGGDGVLVLTVTPAGVHRVGGVSVPSGAGGVQRTMLIGNTLWTLSPAGLQANDATTLAKTAWLPLT